MFKKSLFFAILIMIFTVFLFPEEKDEKEYDDVILYGDEKIELKQEKLDFIPKEAQKITIKEDMSFELFTHQADSLDADTDTDGNLSYNLSVWGGNKVNLGLRADLLFKKNFTLQNSTYFNHNNYDVEDNSILFENNGLWQSNSLWSAFYDFKYEKFDYNNGESTDNFLSKVLLSLKKKSFSSSFGFASTYLGNADVGQVYFLASIFKPFSNVDLKLDSEIGQDILFFNSRISTVNPFLFMDDLSASLIFYRDFDNITFDNLGNVAKEESKYSADIDFNIMKKIGFKGRDFYFSLSREFIYETLYDLYGVNKYFYNTFENKRLYTQTGLSVKTYGSFLKYYYQFTSKFAFLDDYMFFVNPGESSVFSFAMEDNWLFRNEISITRKFDHFDLISNSYVNAYADLDNITYQPLWGSDIAVRFMYWKIDFEPELNYIGLFYRDFDRKNDGGNVFYLNFTASRQIINDHFKFSVKLNNILNNDYEFWDGYNSYPFKLILQLDYKN